MSDESTPFILGDAAADALSEGRRGLFRRRRKRKKEEPRLTHCENCAAPLTGDYCSQCGQHAIDYRRSFLRILIDAADSFLNWDTKFLKSVGILLVKPWKLPTGGDTKKMVLIGVVIGIRVTVLAIFAYKRCKRLEREGKTCVVDEETY